LERPRFIEAKEGIFTKTRIAQEFKTVFNLQHGQRETLHAGISHYNVLNIHFTNNQLMPAMDDIYQPGFSMKNPSKTTKLFA
jgi:hypothetical protein